MSLDQEFGQYKKVELTNYIDEAGVYPIMVESVENSDEKKGYTGKPYFLFNVVDSNSNKKTKIFMFRITDTDSEKAKEFKMKRIKEFFTNLGIDMDKLNGAQILLACKGKICNVLFKESEKILKDKSNNMKPYLSTVIEYSYSKPITEKITPNASYLYSTLPLKEKTRFEHELGIWNKTFGGGVGATQTSGEKNDTAFGKGMEKLEAGKESTEFSVGSQSEEDPF